jgi:glycerate kinase
MIKNILLAPNGFKECADSVRITAIINSILGDRTNLNIIQKPLSDGGDGFLSVLKLLFRNNDITYLIERCYGNYLENKIIQIDKNFYRIFIESADLLGLKVVPKEFRNPAILNSSNLGSVLKEIKKDVVSKKYIVDEVFIV